jgi:hypothetical protein
VDASSRRPPPAPKFRVDFLSNYSWPRSDKSRILSREFKAKLGTIILTVEAAFTDVAPAMDGRAILLSLRLPNGSSRKIE